MLLSYNKPLEVSSELADHAKAMRLTKKYELFGVLKRETKASG